MSAKRTEAKSMADDPMLWFHLAKLSNLSERTDAETSQQMKQSINRVIAILTGQHKQEDEPTSVHLLRQVAVFLQRSELYDEAVSGMAQTLSTKDVS
jgi:hypothetical protein